MSLNICRAGEEGIISEYTAESVLSRAGLQSKTKLSNKYT